MGAKPRPKPIWLLISILFSSLPLSDELALALYEIAFDLYKRDESARGLTGDPAHGEVRNLRKALVLGAIGGLGFEADVETIDGRGHVRFLLTQQGIEARAEAMPVAALN